MATSSNLSRVTFFYETLFSLPKHCKRKYVCQNVRNFSSIRYTLPYQAGISIQECYVKSNSKCSVLFQPYLIQRWYSTQIQDDTSLPIFLKAEKHLSNTAVVDTEGSLSYADILHHSMCLAVNIVETYGAKDMKINGERIGLLTDNNATYVIGLYASWICNGIAVPLCFSHPVSEWEYFLKNSECSLLLVSDTFAEKISPLANQLGIKFLVLSRKNLTRDYEKNRWFQPDQASNPKKVKRMYETRKQRWFDRSEELVMKKPALIIYTSGTTGRPKGVNLTHGNLSACVSGLIKSWGWTSKDTILHILPLNHLHGIANVLLTPLACGATCVIEPKFDAGRVWHMLTSPSISHVDKHINLFMAVPTIYAKLLEYYENHLVKPRVSINSDFILTTLSNKIRLMVSGSSSLPQPISDKWEKVTGHRLLERYGMSEVCMALSCPLSGPRIPGSVGTPLPNVEVRIVKPNVYSSTGYDIIVQGNSQHSIVHQENEPGDLHVRGPSVCLGYWKNPEATTEAFTKDGWFKTGDTAKYLNGVYYIVGRTSVDVIKSGGYKISALEIERHLLAHPDVAECAVVGLPDLTWGQKVAAILVSKPGRKTLDLPTVRQWVSFYLPPYQLPSVVKWIESIPRNSLGKVNKKELVNLVFPELANKKW
ncbi:acyl-CoA synthetase family member 3 mitochondrial [Biomphalaria pfeifferi]|uniref:Acyl-CoA synthetase family member 3 mitochondrial n=1 Tax=Biomphalaria pfeifferi TaxID=112525 RepID=A0AAD8EYA5_BIOPF|nr:acyl-CoA synthetase family member 3 mitochondrial [Biomphalaria pfeifferi]